MYNFKQKLPIRAIIKMAFHCLQQHRVRSALALLGIIIGVAALIATVSVGAGTTDLVIKKVLSLGHNYILVQSGTFLKQGKIGVQKRKKLVPIGQKDIEAIQQQVSHIRFISPVLDDSKQIHYEGVTISGYLKGGNEQILKIMDKHVREGMFFSAMQVQSAARVAVLGARAAEDLFGKQNPLGKIISVDNVSFVVIGVLDKLDIYQSSFQDPNLDVYVPYTTVWKKIIPTTENSFSYVLISADDKQNAQKIVSSIKNILRFRHGIQEGMDSDFNIWDQQDLLKKAQETYSTLNVFLYSASTIAMIVGGIGIMNIMLVSIAERRGEIGIRMAIGASPAAILMQFLTESLILCLVGGFLGVLLGLCIPTLVTYFAGLATVIRPFSIGIALLSTLIIGLFFGFYPAWKAANLNPVDALRSV